jgi:hypothetical protein
MASYTYDAQDVTQGSVADAAYSSGSGTVVSLLKGIFARLAAGAVVALTTPSGTISSGDNALAAVQWHGRRQRCHPSLGVGRERGKR